MLPRRCPLRPIATRWLCRRMHSTRQSVNFLTSRMYQQGIGMQETDILTDNLSCSAAQFLHRISKLLLIEFFDRFGDNEICDWMSRKFRELANKVRLPQNVEDAPWRSSDEYL